MLLGDYHIHSKYSSFNHGHGSILEIGKAALDKGLKEIAISDHGMNHPFFGVKKKRFSVREDEILKANEELRYITIYSGMETNFISTEGVLDSGKVIDRLGVLLAGFHKVVVPLKFGQFFKLTCANFISKNRTKTITRNTDMYIKVLEKYPVDILAHPLRDCLIDLKEVGLVCASKGTYIELNGHNIDLTAGDICALASIGCNFVLDSDAHHPKDVGNVGKALDVFYESGVSLEKLHNWDRLPVFRSGKIIRG